MQTQNMPHPDELDLAIIHALQTQPRVSWTRLGDVLGIDPVTAARRWDRLERTGTAWVDGYLSPGHDDGVYAQVEIDMGGLPLESSLDSLARDSRILSLKQTTGSRDLLAIVGAASIDDLSRLVGQRIARLPGIRTTRVHVITAVPFEGDRWRLRSLSRAQQRALTVPREEVPDEPLRPVDRALALALGHNGRMPVRDLATAAGTSPATVRRRLRVLTGNRRLALRCTLARPLTGFPVSVVYFASVPARHLEDTVASLSTLPELRMCTVTTGRDNLILDLWQRDLADVHSMEAHLESRLADHRLRITERAIVLRTVKHVGRILDRNGRSTGLAPVDYWSGLA
ncbi:Lrp/AsnC family transcriptional regulator [Streptomyces sp. NBC_01166]|uniref:Lrp/AsnC family transcriptional regulator n=1 Tax=Streptomyces sp. NBC_01166 TaxID=2903755 RepID=UPI00386BEA72|nr:Lrp/AsnC family transcriptional regulator [Streptomyces sp. NBC_01166]